MPRKERRELIGKLQEARGGRLLIAYLTSTRRGFEIQIADDVFRILYDHLEADREAAAKGVDLFIHSNGGSGTVPWRIVNLIRNYTEDFAVLVPHHAFSAATLIALGANEIVMHPMGCLGPIDPSVANIFNPPHPQNPGQLAPIGVEDVSAFLRLVKEDVGITHEDELVQTFLALTEKVHPLALGNVQRHHSQSKMMGRKLLKLHMEGEAAEHEITTLVADLKSNLFFHGHPINRREAKEDLRLKVTEPPADIEALMWALYVEYESALNLLEPFNMLHEYATRKQKTVAAPALTTADLVKQMGELVKNGIVLGAGLTPEQYVQLAAAMIPYVSGGKSGDSKVSLEPILGAYVESLARTDAFLTDLRLDYSTINTPNGPQAVVKQEVLWQRWEEEND